MWLFVCLSCVCLFVCLFDCLFVCFVCLIVSLFVCFLVRSFVWGQHVSFLVGMRFVYECRWFACLLVGLFAGLLVCDVFRFSCFSRVRQMCRLCVFCKSFRLFI